MRKESEREVRKEREGGELVWGAGKGTIEDGERHHASSSYVLLVVFLFSVVGPKEGLVWPSPDSNMPLQCQHVLLALPCTVANTGNTGTNSESAKGQGRKSPLHVLILTKKGT